MVLQRHRAVDRVLRQRVGVQVQRVGAGEHQAVVVRLVAVAVDQHDVARPGQGLHDDLVGGRRSVGDEVGVVGVPGHGRLVHRRPDVAVRVQQRVQPPGGGRRLGHEDVAAVELAHVLQGLGVEDAGAPRDGKRVELTDRRRRVGTQGVEKRCGETVPQAREHGAVQVGDIVEPVERAVVDVGLVLGLGSDRLVGEQIEVDVRPQLADPFAAFDPVWVRSIATASIAGSAQQRVHQRHPVVGPQRQVVPDDRRLNLAVQRDRGDGVLDAAPPRAARTAHRRDGLRSARRHSARPSGAVTGASSASSTV